ncbi:MAG TPA: S41 family peptidase [Tenuifilaceae bacterium]|nr:S41 family peptidase [Tenuifilaceae bacterium]
MGVKKVCFLLMLVLPVFSFAQEVTRSQLVEDFNQFVSVVNNFYRAKPLVEERTHSNISEQLASLKMTCDTIQTKEQFANLIRMALNILNDKHAALANGSMVKMYLSKFPAVAVFGGVSISDTLCADYFFNLSTDLFPKMKTGIRSKYIDGHYYNARAFSYKGIFVGVGEEITAINHLPVKAYVEQHKLELFNLAWDETNSQWYSELFWINKSVIESESFELTFGSKSISLNCNQRVDFTQEPKQFVATPLVTSFDSILYVRMPIMYNGEWFAKQVSSSYKNDISKIIIDIRGNRGGEDSAWREVIGSIITEPIAIKTHISMNDNEAVKNILPLYNLDVPQVIVTDTIFPSDSSINYKGDIFILQDADTYSAASSLASVAFQYKHIVTVGYPSPYIGGRGLTPLIFKLHHSGIVFRMPFTVDLSGVPANPYMNKVEVELQQNINEYFERTTIDPYSIEYLTNSDPLIRFVKNAAINAGRL